MGVVTLTVLALAPSVASATAPGANGEVTYVDQQTLLFQDSQGGAELAPEDDVFAVPAAGGAPANLMMTCDRERDVDWSPSGRMVYAVDPISKLATMGPFGSGSQLWSVGGDGSNPRLVLDDTLADFSPRWSPDGSRIAFERWSSGGPDIYVVNSDGTNLSPLATGPDEELAPTWSPDGTRVAFERTAPVAYGQRQKSEIWTENADGSGATLLYDVAPLLIGDMTGDRLDWSPDGSRIAFTTDTGIYAAKADGSGVAPLILGGGGFGWGDPAFSPDGTKLAFGGGDATDPATLGLYTADLADMHPHLLVNVQHGHSADWAPATAHMVAAPPRTTCPNPFPNPPGGDGTGTGGGQPPQKPVKPLSVKFPKTMSIKRLVAGHQKVRVTTAGAMKLRVTVSAPDRKAARRVGVRKGTVIGSSHTAAHAAGRLRVTVPVRRAVRAHLGRLFGRKVRVRIDGSANGKRLGTAQSRIRLVH